MEGPEQLRLTCDAQCGLLSRGSPPSMARSDGGGQLLTGHAQCLHAGVKVGSFHAQDLSITMGHRFYQTLAEAEKTSFR